MDTRTFESIFHLLTILHLPTNMVSPFEYIFARQHRVVFEKSLGHYLSSTQALSLYPIQCSSIQGNCTDEIGCTYVLEYLLFFLLFIHLRVVASMREICSLFAPGPSLCSDLQLLRSQFQGCLAEISTCRLWSRSQARLLAANAVAAD